MDIKLRNKHRLSVVLAVIVVLLASAVMVGLYPFFKNESARYEEPVYGQDEFLRHLVTGNYVLSLEQAQYEQGSVISPFQFYFPQAEEELKNPMAAPAEEGETETAVSEDITAEVAEESYDLTGGQERYEYLKELRRNCIRE